MFFVVVFFSFLSFFVFVCLVGFFCVDIMILIKETHHDIKTAERKQKQVHELCKFTGCLDRSEVHCGIYPCLITCHFALRNTQLKQTLEYFSLLKWLQSNLSSKSARKRHWLRYFEKHIWCKDRDFVQNILIMDLLGIFSLAYKYSY